MKTPFALLLISLFMLSGCEITRVEGRVKDVDVKVSSPDNDRHRDGDKDRDRDRDDNHYDSKFCPPGQAKKGNC